MGVRAAGIRVLQLGSLIVALLATPSKVDAGFVEGHPERIEKRTFEERTIREVMDGSYAAHEVGWQPPKIERLRREPRLDIEQSTRRIKGTLSAPLGAPVPLARAALLESYRKRAFGDNYATAPDEGRIRSLLERTQRRNDVIEHAKVEVKRVLDGHEGLRQYLKTVPNHGQTDIDQVAHAFDPLVRAQVVRTKEPVALLRLFGGDAGKQGRWFVCCADYDRDMSKTALPLGNTMEHLVSLTVLPGTEMVIGTAADQSDPRFRTAGGNAQIFIPRLEVPEAAWKEYLRIEETHVSQMGVHAVGADLIVLHDDVVLRFRPVEERVHSHKRVHSHNGKGLAPSSAASPPQ